MTKKELEVLERIEEKAHVAQQTIIRTRDKKKWRLQELAEKKIDAQMEVEFGKRIEKAVTTYNDAQVAVKKARIEFATANAPFLIGTKMVKWDKKYNCWLSSSTTPNPIVELAAGVFDVVTDDTVFPEGMSQYKKPRVGSYIIRLTRKDGTLGIKFEQLILDGYRKTTDWLPVGKKPKKEKAK
jgi:hypothetical protein